MKLYTLVVWIIRKGLAFSFSSFLARLSSPAHLGCCKCISISFFCLITYASLLFASAYNRRICLLPFWVRLLTCHQVMWCFLVLPSVTWPSQDGCRHGRQSGQSINLRNRFWLFWFLVFRLKPMWFYPPVRFDINKGQRPCCIDSCVIITCLGY